MTTVAERRHCRTRLQRGQSLVEFAFLLPVIVALLTTLIGVEVVMSMAIVSQKYTRQHLHFLMFNHRQYFEEDFLRNPRTNRYHQRFWIGMDKDSNYAAVPTPEAPRYSVGPGPAPAGDRTDRGVSTRQKVRVRITSFTCLPPIGAQFGQPYSEQFLGEQTFGPGYPYCDL